MCGIAGVLARQDLAPLVESIVASQRRRGPDHQAVERISPTLVLGHDRLSIIDLSPGAHQPLFDHTGRLALVFNGEIYNYLELRQELLGLGHRFVTASDSEVILEAFKAWGPAALERFNGMFAFALHDRQTDTLWLARDRFGVKPLYYYQGADVFAFGSTGTAISRHFRLPPNLAYLARGLRYWVYEADDAHSPYEGLFPLPAGHLMEVRLTDRVQTTLHRFYDLEARVPALVDDLASAPLAELTSKVRSLLEDAVGLRLRADVPVGVSLSGGLDSSSVAALVAQRHPGAMGFTFGHPDARASEGPQVQHLARQAGLEVEYVWPSHQQLADAFWETLEAQGAPFPSGSLVAQYLVFKAVRARGVVVLLGGQGGDEIFMGYHKYQLLQLRQLLHRREHKAALVAAAGVATTVLAEAGRAGPYIRALGRYRPGARPASPLRLPEPVPLDLAGSTGWQRQAADVTRFSLPTLLRYEDRNSMGNSVESRLPFLDYRLVELALALPEAIKVRNGYGKWVLREAMAGSVPDAIRLARFKRGFDVPLNAWLAAGLGRTLRERLLAHEADLRPYLAPGVRLASAFGDQQLAKRPAAFAEAVTLAWLAAQGG